MNLMAYVLSVVSALAVWFALLQFTGETQIWFAPVTLATSFFSYFVFVKQLEK